MEPPRPEDAAPVPKYIDPVLPFVASPVLMMTMPETPRVVEPAEAVCSISAPVDVGELNPVMTETRPLVPLLVPEAIKTSPPAPLLPEPTVT